MTTLIRFIGVQRKKLLLLAFAISLVLHFHVLNRDLVGYHVWRQTQTQTVIQNFATEDINIFNPRINDGADGSRIQRMEFPVMQWCFALFYRAFGNHIIISRLLSFLIGLCSVWGFYRLILRMNGNAVMAVIGAWAFSFSPLFYYYTINPLPDNLALCGAIWSLCYCYKKLQLPDDAAALWYSAFFLSLATLAKLPFILYGAAPAMLFLKTQNKSGTNKIQILLPYFFLMLPAIAWYAWVIPQWQNHGIKAGIFDSHASAAQLLDILQHHFVSTLPELIINYGSVLAFISGCYFIFSRRRWLDASFFPLAGVGIAALLYFFYELNMIEKVHDYYLFPFLPPVIIIVSYGAYHLLHAASKPLRWLAFIGLVILPLTAFLRADTRWDTAEPGFNAAYYHNKEKLRSIMPAAAKCIVGNDDSHFILLYYVDRKGWAFDHDHIDAAFMKRCTAHGARYLFSDSRATDDVSIQAFVKQKIFEEGTLKVYELR